MASSTIWLRSMIRQLCHPNVPLSACFNRREVHFCKSAEEAVSDISDGNTVLIGGFGLCGTPERLIDAVVDSNVSNLTVVSCDSGDEEYNVGLLLKKKQVKKIVACFIGENILSETQFLQGDIEVEFVPQGSLIERIRASGAGIPAFYTPTGIGNLIEKGGAVMKYDRNGNIVAVSAKKETRIFNGRKFIMETAINGDFSLIKAWKADTAGNLVFRLSTKSFNEDMAKAAKTVIAEVEEIVEKGELPASEIHVPSVYVDRIVKGHSYLKKISKLKTRQPPEVDRTPLPTQALKEKIARRAVLEIKPGMFVNCGIGIPTLCGNYIASMNAYMHSENGIIGVGPYPFKHEVDADLINASRECVTLALGASISSSSESFSLIRGGHLDITFLGGMQVSQHGDFANWIIPGKLVRGMGGAMDLVASHVNGTKVIVLMTHTSKSGAPKIVSECSLPLTGEKCVDMIITEKGVFTVDKDKGLTLVELAEDISLDNIIGTTGCPISISEDLKTMRES